MKEEKSAMALFLKALTPTYLEQQRHVTTDQLSVHRFLHQVTDISDEDRRSIVDFLSSGETGEPSASEGPKMLLGAISSLRQQLKNIKREIDALNTDAMLTEEEIIFFKDNLLLCEDGQLIITSISARLLQVLNGMDREIFEDWRDVLLSMIEGMQPDEQEHRERTAGFSRQLLQESLSKGWTMRNDDLEDIGVISPKGRKIVGFRKEGKRIALPAGENLRSIEGNIFLGYKNSEQKEGALRVFIELPHDTSPATLDRLSKISASAAGAPSRVAEREGQMLFRLNIGYTPEAYQRCQQQLLTFLQRLETEEDDDSQIAAQRERLEAIVNQLAQPVAQ